MIDGDHVAKAAIDVNCGPFEDVAGQFIADFAGCAPMSRSRRRWGLILSVPQRASTEPLRGRE